MDTANGKPTNAAPTPQFKAHGSSDDVNDFTDLPLLFWNILATSVAALDALGVFVTSLVNVGLATFLSPAASLGSLLYHLLSRKVDPIPSAVNNLDDSFLTGDAPVWRILDGELAHPTVCTSNADPAVRKELLLLLVRICASVYESKALFRKYVSAMGFSGRVDRLLYENCCCAVVSHGQSVVISFKGTSPFNLNEWLCDFSIKKVRATPHVRHLGCHLDGQVHDGFYHALFPPHVSYADTPFARIVAVVREHMTTEGVRAEDLRLWVTGHSLGAAVATAFVIVLANAHPRNADPDDPAGDVAILASRLKGVVTFGNPRVADDSLARTTNDKLRDMSVPFLRVRNGNDIVSIVPIDLRIIPAFVRLLRSWAPAVQGIKALFLNFDYAYVGEGVRYDHLGNDITYEEPDFNLPLTRRTLLYVPYYAASVVLYAWCAMLSAVTPWIPKLVLDRITGGSARRDTFASAAVKVLSFFSFGLSTFITDHIPGEYFKHIALSR